MSGFEKFVIGFSGLGHGISLVLTNNRVRRWALVPLLIAILVFLFGLALGVPVLVGILPMIAETLPKTMNPNLRVGLYWVVLLLTWPAAILALLYLLLVIARALATPFAALLAESALIELGALEPKPLQLGDWLHVNVRMFFASLVKVAALLVIGAGLFALSFVPGLAPFTAFGFLMMVAFDIVDPSLEALALGWGKRIAFARRNWPAYAGLASAMGLVFLVPGLNFILFPAAIAGGADVVRRLSLGETKVVRPRTWM